MEEDWGMKWWRKNTSKWRNDSGGTLGGRYRENLGARWPGYFWPGPYRCLHPAHSPKPRDHLTFQGCHLILRKRDGTGSPLGSWVQWTRIPGNPVSRKMLGFWEAGSWTTCLLSIVQLSALGQASPGSRRPCLSGSWSTDKRSLGNSRLPTVDQAAAAL